MNKKTAECKRQAMIRQLRCNTNRDEVLKLSEQPAALYQTKYGGLPSQACPLLDIHNNILSINVNATVII